MGKRVYMTVLSTPDQPGWNDRVEVWDGDKRLWVGRGSVNPSHLAYPEFYAAKDAGLNPRREDYSWNKQGGLIDYGQYKFETNKNYGGSLLVEGGGKISSQIQNKRHGDEKVMDQIYVHEGYPFVRRGDHPVDSGTVRGSIGCPTIHPDDVEGFRKNFDFVGEKGETGDLIITRPTETPPQGMGDLKPAETNGNQQEVENAKDYITGLVYPWG